MSIVPRRMPSLSGLKAFEASARHLNFRLAAEEMGVTQAAVAQHVRGLEAELGVKLFERLPRTLALTGEGRAYSADVRRAFDILVRATGELKPHSVKVTISATPSFASRWLIPRLPDLTGLHSDLDLHILATERLSSFQTDGVDLAVRYGNPPFGPGLDYKLLFEQEIIAVCSLSLLNEHGSPTTAQELQHYTLLHDAHNFWPEFLDSNLGKADTAFKGISFSQSSHAIEAAIAGQGIVLANRDFVSRDIDAGRLVQAIDGALHGRANFYLVWPRYRKSASLDQLVHWMLEEAAH